MAGQIQLNPADLTIEAEHITRGFSLNGHWRVTATHKPSGTSATANGKTAHGTREVAFDALLAMLEVVVPKPDGPEVGAPQPPEGSGPLVDGWVVTVADGHSGFGAYAHMTEYPDEGAVFLCAAAPSSPRRSR